MISKMKRECFQRLKFGSDAVDRGIKQMLTI